MFVDVVAGGVHSVAVTDSGEVYTWGCNDESVSLQSPPTSAPCMLVLVRFANRPPAKVKRFTGRVEIRSPTCWRPFAEHVGAVFHIASPTALAWIEGTRPDLCSHRRA